nr:MAG TPA: hypothetical protein [Caudoviricetes sp.]
MSKKNVVIDAEVVKEVVENTQPAEVTVSQNWWEKTVAKTKELGGKAWGVVKRNAIPVSIGIGTGLVIAGSVFLGGKTEDDLIDNDLEDDIDDLALSAEEEDLDEDLEIDEDLEDLED